MVKVSEEGGEWGGERERERERERGIEGEREEEATCQAWGRMMIQQRRGMV